MSASISSTTGLCTRKWSAGWTEENGTAAWELVSEHWPALRNSLLMRAQLVRIRVRDFRARSALAAAIHGGSGSHSSAQLYRIAERESQKITQERIPGSDALGNMIMAGAAASRGRQDEARERLAAAEVVFSSLDMLLHAAAARRRRGQLMASDEGQLLMADADAWMRSQLIRNPARMTGMFAPGRYERLSSPAMR